MIKNFKFLKKRINLSLFLVLQFLNNVLFYKNFNTSLQLQKAAKERSELLRSDFILQISDFNPEQLIFIDETAKDERNLSRAYGYSTINTRAKKSVVFIRGNRYTILPALTLNGFIAAEVIEGSCTKELFQAFIINQVVKLYH